MVNPNCCWYFDIVIQSHYWSKKTGAMLFCDAHWSEFLSTAGCRKQQAAAYGSKTSAELFLTRLSSF